MRTGSALSAGGSVRNRPTGDEPSAVAKRYQYGRPGSSRRVRTRRRAIPVAPSAAMRSRCTTRANPGSAATSSPSAPGRSAAACCVHSVAARGAGCPAMTPCGNVPPRASGGAGRAAVRSRRRGRAASASGAARSAPTPERTNARRLAGGIGPFYQEPARRTRGRCRGRSSSGGRAAAARASGLTPAPVRAEADLGPGARPLAPPGERAPAVRAGLRRQVPLAAHAPRPTRANGPRITVAARR
jgi:hypothetical protein